MLIQFFLMSVGTTIFMHWPVNAEVLYLYTII